MYNRVFKADVLLYKAGCSIETVAFLEIVLKFFEGARLPATEEFLSAEHTFKLEDIVDAVFDKDSKNRFTNITFPDSYKNDSELINNLEAMFASEDKYGIRGKTFDELVEAYNKTYHSDIRSMRNLFDILVEGISIVLSKEPYGFCCCYKSIEGTIYFIVNSWATIGKYH